MLFVLVGVAVIVVVLVLAVIVIVLVLAFVLVGVAVIVVVLVLAVIVVAFVLAKDADLLLIPTAARLSGAIHPGGRACSASSSRGASARSILAGPEGVPMSQVGCLRGEVNTIVSVPLWQMVTFPVVVPVVVVVVVPVVGPMSPSQ